MNTANFVALFVVIAYLQTGINARDCVIQNLPSSSYRKGDVHFIEYPQDSSVSLTLECRCFVVTPEWQYYKMDSFTLSKSDDPIHCKNNGETCQNTHIALSDRNAPHFYLYQTTVFDIREPSVLMCTAGGARVVVVVTVNKEPTEPVPAPAACSPSTASSTSIQQHGSHTDDVMGTTSTTPRSTNSPELAS